MIITDETIMPDGRPFFAWRNELEMLRSEVQALKPAQDRVSDQMRLLNIARIESIQEPWSGDLVIRFRMIDRVNSLSKDDMKYMRESASQKT